MPSLHFTFLRGQHCRQGGLVVIHEITDERDAHRPERLLVQGHQLPGGLVQAPARGLPVLLDVRPIWELGHRRAEPAEVLPIGTRAGIPRAARGGGRPLSSQREGANLWVSQAIWRCEVDIDLSENP